MDKVNVSSILKHGQTESSDETAKNVEEITTSLQRDIDQICQDKIENIVEVYIEELPTCDDAGDCHSAGPSLAEDAQSRNIENLCDENDKADVNASPRDGDSHTDVNNGQLDGAKEHATEEIILEKGDETAKTVEEIATSLQRDIDQICRDKIENIVEVYIEELPTCDDAGNCKATSSLLAEGAQSRNNENVEAHNDASSPRDGGSGTDVNDGQLDVAPEHTKEVIILGEDALQTLQDDNQQPFQQGDDTSQSAVVGIISKPLEDIDVKSQTVTPSKSSKGFRTRRPLYKCTTCNRTCGNKAHFEEHLRIHTGEKPFQCSECNKSFITKSHLTRHMKQLHKPHKTAFDRFICSYCKLSLPSKAHLDSHLRKHTERKLVECSVCRKTFTKKIHLVEHLRIHTGEKPFKCVKCNRSFITKSHLRRHVQLHFGGKTKPKKQLKCSYCSASFYRSFHLVEHERSHTGERPFPCSECKWSFMTKSHLLRHLRTQHTGSKLTEKNDQVVNIRLTRVLKRGTKFKCQDCEKSFQSRSLLAKHSREHNIGETELMETLDLERSFRCVQCNIMFPEESLRDEHVKSHSAVMADVPEPETINHVCSHCGCIFSDQRQLDDHVKCHTGNEVEGTPQCPTGDEMSTKNSDPVTHEVDESPECAFSDDEYSAEKLQPKEHGKNKVQEKGAENIVDGESDLMAHVKVHEGRSHLKCSYCDHLFGNKHHLTEHIRTHTGERPFPCPHCDWSFMTKSHLTRHLRTHTGEKRHECSYCSKKFLESTQLKEHIRQHTGERPYECSECKKRFISSGSLRCHMRRHGVEKSHRCIHCSKVFCWESHLEEHLRIHQEEEPQVQSDLPQKDESNSENEESHLHVSVPEDINMIERVGKDLQSPEPSNSYTLEPDPTTKKETESVNKIHQCPYCARELATKHLLIEHIRIHTGERPFPCPECDWSFKTKSHLNRHLKTHGRTYHCSQCSDIFSSKYLLMQHMSTHREAPHYCTVCNKWFSSESGLLTHCKEHDGDSSDVKNEDPTPCGNADSDSQASDTIEVENAKMEKVTPSESQSEEETYECSYCMKLFSDISQFVEHIGICYKLSTTKPPTNIHSSKVSADVADAGYLKCSFCGCTFSEKCHLDEHVKIHSGEDSAEESYGCQNCSETFSTQSDLTTHMIKHDGEHAFVCIYCSRSFPEQALLEEHFKVHEAEDSPESYQCSKCDQFFMRQSDLTKHMKKAHKIFPGYNCSYCGNTFANKNHLTEHERSHTGERPFPCTECEWSFMTKSHLRRHMRTHNRENPLKGSYCSVTFSSTKHLDNHTRNAHRCSVCKECFPSKASLIAHSKTHTEDISDAGSSVVIVKDSNADDHEGNIDTDSDSSEVHDMQADLTPESPTLDGVTVDECSHSQEAPFPEQALLEEHSKVHEVEDSPESHQCSECDQVFTRQSVLTKHMKKAHNILPGYKCSYCGNTFANKNHFTEHERSHTGERPFPCTKCDWSFMRKSHLRNHMRTHVQDTQTELTPENQTLDGVTVAYESSHSQDYNKTTLSAQSDGTTHMINHDKDEAFACIYCSHSFPEQALLKEHLKVHDSVGSLKSYQCSECDQVFMRQSVLTKHMKKAHDILPGYKCSYCGNTFANKNHLTEHERSHTGERPFPCTECDWSFMTKSHLRNHMRTHAQENPLFKCTYCSATFSKKGLLEEHVRIHTGEEIVEENFHCSECSEIFTAHADLTEHMRSHAAEASFVCTICGSLFSEQSGLDEHALIHTEAETEKKFGCSECGMMFAVESDLTMHMKRVHKIRPHLVCSFCGNKFANKYHLTEHVRSHTGERPFPCAECNWSFMTKSHLRRHMKTHTGEKPHECTYCPQKFAVKTRLIEHIRIHTGERPFQCTECFKHFTSKCNYKSHMKTHSGYKPYQCSFCPKAYCKRNRLNEHLKKHTEKKPFNCSICDMGFVRKAHKTRHMMLHGDKEAQ